MNWLARGALVAAFLAVGCSDGDKNNNNGDGGVSNACTAGAKECIGDKVARQCQADGHWAAFKCVAGHCNAGDCVPDEVTTPEEQICLPGEGACQGSMALTCNATGTDYTATACPSGTTCVGPGLCQGTCVIGQGFCADTGHTAICLDGKAYTTVACAANTLCVAGDNGVISTASCKASDCTPSNDGCDSVCGDKVTPSNDPTKAISRCVETPAGYKWQVLPCPGTSFCAPGVSECGFTGAEGAEAACVNTCIDGTQRCNAAGNIETCANNVFATSTSCTDGKKCVVDAADATKAVCGDAACATGVGVCTADGLFAACGSSGTLGAPAACATGICVSDSPGGSTTGAVNGRCSTLCTEGEGRCVDSGSGQRCKNGRWDEQVLCTDNAKPCGSAVIGGVRKIDCIAECFPGTKECTSNALIRTCNDDGTWGDATQCAMGSCNDDNEPVCVVECLPGQVECDDFLNESYPTVYGKSVTCTDEGRWGTPVACSGDQGCRYNFAGKSLGCVDCAGFNEVGQPDSRCTDGNAVQQCDTNNTWKAATLACRNDTECVDAELVETFPDFTLTEESCGFTQTDIEAVFGPGVTCDDLGAGDAISCGGESDCCSAVCDKPGVVPAPAHCEAPAVN